MYVHCTLGKGTEVRKTKRKQGKRSGKKKKIFYGWSYLDRFEMRTDLDGEKNFYR